MLDSLTVWQDNRVLNLYRYTGNPATIGQSSIPQYGYATLHAGIETGNFKRPMQAQQTTVLKGATGGQRLVNGWLYSGDFSYGKQYDREVAWSAVYDPYEGNPFIWADSSIGNWERDEVKATVSVVAPQLNRWLVGMRIGYEVSTGARKNDPRPFFRHRDMVVQPGLTYQLNTRSEIGLSGSAGFAKEENEMGFYTQSNTFLLYRLRGFGTFNKSPFVNGERRRDELRWLATAHYRTKWKNRQVLVSGYISQREDEVVEGVSAPQLTGYFTSIQVGGAAVVRSGDESNGSLFSLNAFLHDGYADDVVFRAESASFSKQGIGLHSSYWKAAGTKGTIWQFDLDPKLAYYSYADYGTRTAFEVSQLSVAAQVRYRKQLSSTAQLLLSPRFAYYIPVLDSYTSSRPTVITEQLVFPDYLFFATRFTELQMKAGFSLSPKNSSLAHALQFQAGKQFAGRNNIQLLYSILF